MNRRGLKSFVFRREREGGWRELDELVKRAERRGVRGLSLADVLRLPTLYFAALSSLSVARSISLDQNVVTYLESLGSRAYFVVYGAPSNFWRTVGLFFRAHLPRAVRSLSGALLVAAIALAAGTAAGYALTIENPDWYYSFVPGELTQGRTPTASREELREVLFGGAGGADELSVFATWLFTHNAGVGILSFALGVAFGVPTLILLVETGLMLGAFFALYVSRGLGVELGGWLAIHGVTEILALLLCGAAGISIGGAIAFPGRRTRLANLAARGRVAAQVMIGAIVMFLCAGLLEGLGRQLINDTTLRYLIAGATLVLWTLYYLAGGRRADDGDGR